MTITRLHSTRRRLLTDHLPVMVLARLSGMRGVEVIEGQAAFDRRLHTPETATVALRYANREPISLNAAPRRLSVTKATAADMARINAIASDELRAEDVLIFEDYAISNGPMRRPLRVDSSALRKFAADFRGGRTTLLHHREDLPIGSTFDAEVRSDTSGGVDAEWLVVRHFAVTLDATPERLQHLRDMRSGPLRHTSITFGGGALSYVEGERGDYLLVTDNPAANESERLEGLELSRVYLGAVVGAGSLSVTGDSADPSDVLPSKQEQGAKPRRIILL